MYMYASFPQQIALPKPWRESLPLSQQGWLSKMLYRRTTPTGKPEIIPNPCMWFYPPQSPQVHSSPPASPGVYFQEPFFLWAPQRVWGLDLRCNKECRAKQDEKKVTVCTPSFLLTFCTYRTLLRFLWMQFPLCEDLQQYFNVLLRDN